jgi:hypothetical protein
MAAVCHAARGESEPPVADVPPVVFDGFGFDAGCATPPLDMAPATPPSVVPLDILVRGPTGRDVAAEQLATEIRSRIESLDVSAGVVATRGSIHDGVAAWTGGVALAAEHEMGRDVIELRTSLAPARQAGVLGIEVGPRIERRLRRGTVLFFDGKAEAKTQRSVETGGWLLPGDAAEGMVGVAARTGLTR